MLKRHAFALLLLAPAACSDQPTTPTESSGFEPGFVATATGPGHVYVVGNGAAGNEVLMFDRAADGTLTAAAAVSTGGLGTGAGLGSQGAIVLSENQRWVFAVNAGSDELSVFRVDVSGLTLTDVIGSGGDMPISVTMKAGIVYVLNAGGAGNITGYSLGDNGILAPIPGSTRPLSGAGVGPAQIQFSPDGDFLVVTEKNTNRIVTYAVDRDGVAGAPNAQASAGVTPFGFGFAGRDRLIVSEAFGGATDASAASSYRLGRTGIVHVISGPVPTTETAACWVAISRNGRYAYVTNTGSASVTGYAIGPEGALEILDADGVTGMAGVTPIDADFSRNGQYLYVLNAGSHSISIFAVASDGSLTSVQELTGLPSSAVGIAAR
jgi:6-phosphogluconolactonase (cycloisomerase 2 family)